MKKNFLENLSRFCEYDYDSKNKMYNITNVFSTQVPKSFSKFNNGISKYIIPLMLKTILTERDKNDKIEIPIDKFLTFSRWAKKINMVNDNYSLVRNNSKTISDMYDLDMSNTVDFINRLTDHINYHIQQSLDRLQSLSVIKYYKKPIIFVETYEDVHLEGHTVHGRKFEEKRYATDEEVRYIIECELLAEKEAGIDAVFFDKKTQKYKSGKYQRYFGDKSAIYKSILNRELFKRNILCAYDAYAVFMIDEKRCKDVLNMFGISNFNNFKIQFNDFLKDFLKDNASKRWDEKYNDFLLDNKDELELIIENQMCRKKKIDDYDALSKITIDKNAEHIWNKVNKYSDKSGTLNKSKQDSYIVEIIDEGNRHRSKE